VAKKQVSIVTVVIVLVVFGVISTGMIMWVTDTGPIVRLKAGSYAREIASLDGDRGAATIKLCSLGHDVALPYALEMIKSSEYTTRAYGYNILDTIKAVEASGEIITAVLADDNTTNRAKAIMVLMHLCPDYRIDPKGQAQFKAKYLERLIKLLDDREPEVRRSLCAAMSGFSGTYNPDHDAAWWKEWWEKNKPGAAEKPAEKTAEAPK